MYINISSKTPNTYTHCSVAVDNPHDSWAWGTGHTDAETSPVSLLHHQALRFLQHLRLAPLLLLLDSGLTMSVDDKNNT